MGNVGVYSIRRLELAARAKRREDWNRLAFLRLDLRRLLLKNPTTKHACDLNPIYTQEERAGIKRRAREEERRNLPKATAEEVFEALNAAKR